MFTVLGGLPKFQGSAASPPPHLPRAPPTIFMAYSRVTPIEDFASASDYSMTSRQRGPKPSESLIDPAYYHKCDYQTSNSSAFADPQIVYSKTYKEKTVPELQQDLRAKPLLTSTSCVGQHARDLTMLAQF
jgi:hypothetical protein